MLNSRKQFNNNMSKSFVRPFANAMRHVDLITKNSERSFANAVRHVGLNSHSGPVLP